MTKQLNSLVRQNSSWRHRLMCMLAWFWQKAATIYTACQILFWQGVRTSVVYAFNTHSHWGWTHCEYMWAWNNYEQLVLATKQTQISNQSNNFIALFLTQTSVTIAHQFLRTVPVGRIQQPDGFMENTHLCESTGMIPGKTDQSSERAYVCFHEMLPWMVCCSTVMCSKQDASSRRRLVTQLQVLSGPKRLFFCFQIPSGTPKKKLSACKSASCPRTHFYSCGGTVFKLYIICLIGVKQAIAWTER